MRKENGNWELERILPEKELRERYGLNQCRQLFSKFVSKLYLGSEQEEWERTEVFLRSLAPMAKEFNITICMENIYTGSGNHIIEEPCCDARKAAARIDRINAEYGAEVLGFCFDTGHANLVGLGFEDFITTLDDRLKVLHIHDNDGIEDLHQIPYTFSRGRENKPATDWKGFLAGLGKIKFDKVLSFETAPVLSAFPDRMKQDVLGFIAQIGLFWAGEVERRRFHNNFVI